MKDGVPPSAEAVCCIAPTISALCLNARGLEACKQEGILNFLVEVLTSRKYSKAVHGDCPSVLGSGMDELMRHVPQLRELAVEIAIEAIKKVKKRYPLEFEIFLETCA